MDFKKVNAPTTTVTRDMNGFCADKNIYEVVNVISRRANQISIDIKNELEKKLMEFATTTDTFDEVCENREQIEISRYYEKLPKPVLIAAKEYEDGDIAYHYSGKAPKK